MALKCREVWFIWISLYLIFFFLTVLDIFTFVFVIYHVYVSRHRCWLYYSNFNFHLPVQSVSITTNVVSSNPANGGCTRHKLCDKVCQWLAAGQWFSLGTAVSSINETDRHYITERLIKVALNIITPKTQIIICLCMYFYLSLCFFFKSTFEIANCLKLMHV